MRLRVPFTSHSELASGKDERIVFHPLRLTHAPSTLVSHAYETAAFSPLGPDAKSFHVPLKFAEIYVR